MSALKYFLAVLFVGIVGIPLLLAASILCALATPFVLLYWVYSTAAAEWSESC